MPARYKGRSVCFLAWQEPVYYVSCISYIVLSEVRRAKQKGIFTYVS